MDTVEQVKSLDAATKTGVIGTAMDESSPSSTRRTKAARQKTFPFRRTTPYKRSKVAQSSGPDEIIANGVNTEQEMETGEDRSSSPNQPPVSAALSSPRAIRERSLDRLHGLGKGSMMVTLNSI